MLISFLIALSVSAEEPLEACKEVVPQLMLTFYRQVTDNPDAESNAVANDVLHNCLNDTDETRHQLLVELVAKVRASVKIYKQVKNYKKFKPQQIEERYKLALTEGLVNTLEEGPLKAAFVELLDFSKTPLMATIADAEQYNARMPLSDVYNPIQKSERKFTGKTICLAGVIQQAKETQNETGFRVTDSNGDFNSLVRFRGVDTDECQVNSFLRTCGTFKGLTTYPSIAGVLNTVPMFEATLIRCNDAVYQAKR